MSCVNMGEKIVPANGERPIALQVNYSSVSDIATSLTTEVELFLNDALQLVDGLDEYLSKHGKPIGPLHGVVMTLKDHFDV